MVDLYIYQWLKTRFSPLSYLIELSKLERPRPTTHSVITPSCGYFGKFLGQRRCFRWNASFNLIVFKHCIAFSYLGEWRSDCTLSPPSAHHWFLPTTVDNCGSENWGLDPRNYLVVYICSLFKLKCICAMWTEMLQIKNMIVRFFVFPRILPPV